VQLSAFADLESGTWDVAIDGRWLRDGPGDAPVVDFEPFEPANVGSARLLAVWLENGETYTLSALRPANAKGHDKDRIAVALPEAQGALRVFDPRLSTEYSATGVPQRFGVELWLGEDPDADQHPLRLGGEAQPETAPLSAGQLSIHPMRAHSAGISGLGLYVLVQ
jgi:hypothetical protein